MLFRSYCSKKLYAQCPVYKKVGVTAGYEPAGGGFAQYVRVMDWIVERGIEKIPDGVSFDAASFVEPVNTCLNGMRQIDPQPGDVVAILGKGHETGQEINGEKLPFDDRKVLANAIAGRK